MKNYKATFAMICAISTIICTSCVQPEQNKSASQSETNSSLEKSEEIKLEQKTAKIKQQMTKILDDNKITNALIMNDFDIFDYNFSINLEDRLKGNYVAISSSINDIERKEDGIYLIITDYIAYWNLKISEQQYNNFIKYFENKKTDIFKDMIIIIKVENARKGKVNIYPSGNSEDGYNFDFRVSDAFVINGTCIDIKPFIE